MWSRGVLVGAEVQSQSTLVRPHLHEGDICQTSFLIIRQYEVLQATQESNVYSVYRSDISEQYLKIDFT